MFKTVLNVFFISLCIASLVCVVYLTVYRPELLQYQVAKKEAVTEVEPKNPTNSFTPKLINEHSI